MNGAALKDVDEDHDNTSENGSQPDSESGNAERPSRKDTAIKT